MDFQITSNIDMSCFLVETKFSIGIFLSSDIINRNCHAKKMYVTKYPCYQSAYEEMLRRYGEELLDTTIFPNRLYTVRDKNCYTVFYNSQIVGITYTESFVDSIWGICRKDANEFLYKHSLCYEDAIRFASERFVRYYNNGNFYISSGLGINRIVTLSEVVAKNKTMI